MLKATKTVDSKPACNMFILHSKWLSNSKALYFSWSVEFKKSLCKISHK